MNENSKQVSPDDIRDFLIHVLGAARIAAKWTPTTVDDRLVTLLELILGSEPQPAEPQRAAISIPWDRLPWDRILPLLMPLLINALEKWLNSLSNNNSK